MTNTTEAQRIALATIPPEAEEAAKREAAATVYRIVEPDTRAHELTEDEVAQIATTALRAGIAAWPGMFYSPGSQVTRTWFDPGKIILPTPRENTNAEGRTSAG